MTCCCVSSCVELKEVKSESFLLQLLGNIYETVLRAFEVLEP